MDGKSHTHTNTHTTHTHTHTHTPHTHTHTQTHTHTYIYIYIYIKCSRYRPGVAQRVGRGIALLFHDRGTRRGWVVSSMPRPHFTPGKDPVPILQEAGWAPGPVWTGGNLVPTGIRSRTVQPLVSRYTDWATRPIYIYIYKAKVIPLQARCGPESG